MPRTPYYLIDKSALSHNMQIIDRVREDAGVKVLLALKCFAAWAVFDVMKPHMDGTTSSSLYEVKLGRTRFGGETHAYSVGFADHEIREVVAHCDKIIFNSIGQLQRFRGVAGGKPVGLRLNPGVSCTGFDLADPARPYSRLGECDPARIRSVLDRIDGVMIHNNCENNEFDRFDALLTEIEHSYADILNRLGWVSLGGDEYDLPARSRAISRKLEVIQETSDTMTDLMATRTSHRLEWYIIILIAIEIALGLYDRFLK